MSAWKDEDLENLYQEADFDSDHAEVKEIKSSVCSLVEELTNFIASEDSLFENSVIRSGSFFEDLKVEGPDEFDFMICLEDLSTDPGAARKRKFFQARFEIRVTLTFKSHPRLIGGSGNTTFLNKEI